VEEQYAIDPENHAGGLLEYFAEMEAKHGVVVNERRNWYYAKEKTLGDDEARIPDHSGRGVPAVCRGRVLRKQFRWLYTNKRIGQIPDNSHLLHVLGYRCGRLHGDLVRSQGQEFHIIDYYENSGEGLHTT
jgi:hypothetical protein